ncbi:HRDC domain-containing protein, partial [Parabacteroides sp. OttesenSCG-928-G21]|nr:HRDC domain-containing protein [Parabacteroides sp. OttesenSCG-928-G21]
AGSFTQYPLKTAWAITIHKSQGLTFERAIIDAAAAFSHGQVYVALSRCRSLDGLVLSNPINRNAMISDGKIRQYTDCLSAIKATEESLQIAEHRYYLHLVTELFDFTVVQQRLQYAAHVVYSHLQRLYPKMVEQYAVARADFHQEITEVGNRFQQQLTQMITGNPNYKEDEVIQERIRKGTAYFHEKIKQICFPLRENAHVEIDNKETLKLVTKAVNNLIDELTIKIAVLTVCRDGFMIPSYLAAKAKAHIEPEGKKKEKVSRAKKTKESVAIAVDTSDIKNPALYAALRQWRNKIAAQKGLPVYTVLQQKALIGLSNVVPSSTKEMLLIPGIGKKVLDKYGEELMEIIKKEL